MQLLQRWVAALDTVSEQTTILHLYIGMAHVDRRNFVEAKASLDLANRSIESDVDSLAHVISSILSAQIAIWEQNYEEAIRAVDRAEGFARPGTEAKYLAEAKKIRARAVAVLTADYESAERILLEAVNLVEDANDQYALAAALGALAELQRGAGKPYEGYQSAGMAVQALLKIGSSTPLSAALLNHAVSAHILGYYQEALRLFQDALRHARRAFNPGGEANICIAQGLLFSNLGMSEQAASLYDIGLALAARTENVPMLRWGFIQSAILHRRNGSEPIAAEWLKRAIRIGNQQQPPGFVQVQQAALETNIRPDRALSRIDRLLGGEGPPLDDWDRTFALYFQFRAVLSQGDESEAERLISELCRWTISKGTDQLVASELEHDSDAMQFVESKSEQNPSLRALLDRVDRMRSFVKQFVGSEELEESDPRKRIHALGTVEIPQETDPGMCSWRPSGRRYLLDARCPTCIPQSTAFEGHSDARPSTMMARFTVYKSESYWISMLITLNARRKQQIDFR
jgi:tetratricopeptide (TPR) repeat protein